MAHMWGGALDGTLFATVDGVVKFASLRRRRMVSDYAESAARQHPDPARGAAIRSSARDFLRFPVSCAKTRATISPCGSPGT